MPDPAPAPAPADEDLTLDDFEPVLIGTAPDGTRLFTLELLPDAERAERKPRRRRKRNATWSA